jgi:mono/diheme cytochrome c family protein
MRKTMISSLVVLLAAASGVSRAGEEAAEVVARGQQLADALCATCHLRGNEAEKLGASGVPGFRAVANRPNQTPEQIARWLRSVPAAMPNHHLTQDEVEALAAFIMSLRSESDAPR